MTKYKFPCGCEFEVVNDEIKECDGLPALAIDYYNLPDNCPATWELIQSGHTKGIFQLETNLGRKWSKELLPRDINEMAALISLIRPGCVSGDTKILVNMWPNNRRSSYKHMSLEKLYKNKRHYPNIISYDSNSGELVKNKVVDIIYMGKKDVYKIKLNKSTKSHFEKIHTDYYNLQCTNDHPLLTPNGWVQLQDMKIGDRFAVLKIRRRKKLVRNIAGERYFRDLCFQNYEYKCIFCNWHKGSLDVNHLDGNRKTNNNIDNLCYMCPNHHRMYSEGNITKQQVIKARKKHILPKHEFISWAEFRGMELVGTKDTYDITMEYPHHNFIAGSTIVHNCLRSIIDGKSMTQLYCDRKNGKEEIKYFHQALEPILKETYGVLTYQEEILKIAQIIAGFTMEEADILRKAIGHKQADVMAQIKQKFIDGCKKANIVNEEEAIAIFGWIQESQRYSFNASHGVAYGTIGYWTAYVKAHFPLHFVTAWLYYAHEKMDAQEEVQQLVSDARYFNIMVCPPSLTRLFNGDPGHFSMFKDSVYFGIGDIKKIGESHVKKVLTSVSELELSLGKAIGEWNWCDFLIHFSDTVSQTVVNGLVQAGATDYMGGSRSEKIHEFNEWRKLTQKERDWIKSDIPKTKLIDSISSLLANIKRLSAPRRLKIEDIVKSLNSPSFSLEDDAYYIADHEKELLGIPLTCTKLDTCHNEIEPNTTCKEFLQGKSGNISIRVEIIGVSEYIIKNGKSKGQKMLFLQVEDDTGSLESVVVFPNVLHENQSILINGGTVVLEGKRDAKQTNSFIVENVIPI